MKVLIIGRFHNKNEVGLNYMLQYLGWNFKNGSVNDIPNYDVVYMPNNPIDTSKYPNKKFIFGPHFSVFPNQKLLRINNVHRNSIYIQPSAWVVNLWEYIKDCIQVKVLPFPVQINKFKPINDKREKVFIYFKSRKIEELEYIKDELALKNIQYTIFDYRRRYSEIDYLNDLQQSKYGIWIGRHESQGFALEEALSCDVPLLVWDVTSMNQEEGYNYDNIPATCIPYWDERCGEIFYKREEFESKFDEFISKLDTYKPREYILENLSIKKCAENLKRLIQEIKPNEIK